MIIYMYIFHHQFDIYVWLPQMACVIGNLMV